MLEDYLT